MADRRVEPDDMLNRPGTYFNPQTEVMVVVDDSPSMDSEIFNLEEFEGADWVMISDDVPVDEDGRDRLLQDFQRTYHGGDGRQVGVEVDDDTPDLDDDAGQGEETYEP